MSYVTILKFFSFLLGTMIGSFLNAVIYRIPREISIVKTKRSHCPGCNKIIIWYENIPIFSFLFLRGKCSACGFKIPLRYFLIELFTGIFFLLLFPIELSQESLIFYFFHITVLTCFVAHFFIDIDVQILPDSINIILAIVFAAMGLYRYGWIHTGLGGLVGFFMPYGISWLFYKIKGQIGLGGGDIKLFGALGLYLGFAGIFQNLFLSSMVGSVIGFAIILLFKHKKEVPFAFGPAIIITASFQIFFENHFGQLMNFFFYR